MAQLKSTNVTGNLAITGNVLASKILKLGGTSDDILMGDGSTTSKQGLIDSLESAMEGNTWRPVKYGTTTVNDTSTTLEFVAGSNIGLTFSGGKLTIANSYSYSLPLAASGTRGGIQIGYTSTENNRAVTLDSEKAYISLPSRLNDYKPSTENAPSTNGWYFFNDTTNESAKTAFGSSAQAATWVSAYSNTWAGQIGISYYGDQIAFRRKQNTATWASWIPIATQEWVEAKGYLTSHQSLANYVTLDGAQTITGIKTFSTHIKTAENTMGIKLRTHDNYETGWVYGTSGNEAITLAMQNPVTAFQIVYGTKPSAFGGSTWQTVTPLFQTKDGKVIINRKITATADTTSLKLLDVNGEIAATTIYENGTSLADKYAAKNHNHDGTYLKAVTSTDNAIVRFDGTGGAIQNSAATIDDNGYITTPRLLITQNGNTVTIGSQNASYCHIYNSASIPFIFNQDVLVTGDKDLGSSSYDWKNLYMSGNIIKGSYTLTLPSKTGTVALTSDIKNPTDYYWANVKVASTSSAATTPTFASVTLATSGGTAKAAFSYNSSDDCIELNWRN